MLRGFLKSYALVKKSFKRPGFFSVAMEEHIYRELSFLVTPLFLMLNVSANAASYINLAIGLGAAVSICQGTYQGILLGYALFFISEIVDRVDGNISRVTGIATFYGKFIDGFFDIVTLTIFRLALSYWIFLNALPNSLFWLGLICVILTPYHHLMFDRYSAFVRWINEATGASLKPYIRMDAYEKLLNVLDDLQYVALVTSIFYLTNGLYLYFCVNILTSSLFLFNHLKATSAVMRVKKVSPKLSQDFINKGV